MLAHRCFVQRRKAIESDVLRTDPAGRGPIGVFGVVDVVEIADVAVLVGAVDLGALGDARGAAAAVVRCIFVGSLVFHDPVHH